MLIVSESAAALKGFLAQTGCYVRARTMLLRVVLNRASVKNLADAVRVSEKLVENGSTVL